MTPKVVAHDQPALPAVVASQPVVSMPAQQAYAEPSARRSSEGGVAINGRVVDAGGDIFENYEVQRGDHVDELARAFNTSRDVLLEANRIRSPYVIHPGEIIKVPVAKAYVAESGDTLGGVARRFGVEESELAQLNHVSERAALRPGERIGLPSSMRDRGPLRSYAPEYAEAAPRRYEPGYVMPPAHPGLTPLNPTAPTTPDRAAGYEAPPPSAAIAQAPTLSDADISAAAKGRFVWPVHGDILIKFGSMGVGRRNDGIDIKAAQGAAVQAAAGGEVVYAGDQVPGFGNLVLIKHPDGWVTAYAHLDQVSVHMKDQVSQGQTVGTVGESGGVAEPELHFEVRYTPTLADKALPVDPVLVLPQG
jgi:murein DD-endopeptidase MepM/ murein hydrolase activator NlpD